MNLKNLHSRKERVATVTPHPIAAALLENTKRNIHILPVTVAQPQNLLRVARKLTPSNYQEEEEFRPTPTYVEPTESEQDLKALSDLIGKNPNVQLQGLQQLLENPSHVKLIMPVENDPSPFQVNSENFASNQHAADINAAVEEQSINPAISKLQAQLDATARIQAQNAIVAAQRQALAHVEEQHKAIAKAQEEARLIAMEKVRAHNEAISQVYIHKKEDAVAEDVAPTQTAENRIHTTAPQLIQEPQAHNDAFLQAQHYQQVVPTQHVVYEPAQEELQKLAEESNRAYGNEHEDVSRSKCKTFVYEKLEMFRQQFCNHFKYSPKWAVKNETLKDFVLELNCIKIERAKNFFSTKLQEMYRENRKAFFSLCRFNISNIQLTNEFVFSNNLTDFNENMLRQKREIGDDYGNDDEYYDDEVVSESKNETERVDSEILPSAEKLVATPKYTANTRFPPYHYINRSPIQKDEYKDKEPTNVIVINNSNDNHNHGANVKLNQPVLHRPPLKHRHKKPKRTRVHKIVIYKKPSLKKILSVSKKVDTVLSKLGHTIRLR